MALFPQTNTIAINPTCLLYKKIMVLKIEVTALLALTCLQLVLTIEYRSQMVSQRISYFENPTFDMDVKFYGDEGYPYLTLNEEITPYNDLHLMVYAKKYDKDQILLSHSPVSLCQLLHDTEVATNKEFLSSPAVKFNLLQTFNFKGKHCPIEQSTIRLSPYIFPSNFTFDDSLGCGYKTIESRLMKCSDELVDGVRDCETLLKNTMYAKIEHDECSKNPEISGLELENGWVFDKFIYLIKNLSG